MENIQNYESKETTVKSYTDHILLGYINLANHLLILNPFILNEKPANYWESTFHMLLFDFA